jgi:hypothetical protein
MIDPKARGGVRRYLDTVKPEEYLPNTGEVRLSEMSLTGLADLFGSDKGNIKHRYTQVYEPLISLLCSQQGDSRQTAQLYIAEAGVACGASLHMWSRYLPESTIIGYDVRPECADLCRDLENVRIVIGDPAKMEEPSDAPFDVFIDDASHISEQIVAMFKNCWPWVRRGGFYIIEDLGCTYSDAYTQQFRKHFDSSAVNDRTTVLNMIDHLMKCVDSYSEIAEINYYPQLLVLRKL